MSSSDRGRRRAAAVPVNYNEGSSSAFRGHAGFELEDDEEEVKEVQPLRRKLGRRTAAEESKASAPADSDDWAFNTRDEATDGEAEYGDEEVRRARQESTSPLLNSRGLRNRSAVNYTKTRIIRDSSSKARSRAAAGRSREQREAPRGPPPSKRRRVLVEEEDEDEVGYEEKEERREEKAEKRWWAEERQRRSGRTSGRQVDYTSRKLDEAIRLATRPDAAAPQPPRKQTASDRAHHRQPRWTPEEEEQDTGQDVDMINVEEEGEEGEDEGAEQTDGNESKAPPLTDSEDEGWQGSTQKALDPGEARWQFEAEQWAGWDVTRLLGVRYADDADPSAPPPPTAGTDASSSSSSPSSTRSPQRTEYLVKWRNRGYLHCKWLDARTLLHMPFHVKAMITRFHRKHPNAAAASSSPNVEQAEDGSLVQLEEGQYYNPDYLQVDRIISRKRGTRDGDDEFYVKWKGLGYEEATWETAADIDNDEEIARYFRYSQPPPPNMGEEQRRTSLVRSQTGVTALVKQLDFKGGRQLRDYQIEGVSWMAYNYLRGRPCLLADEMGLGKTAQTIGLCAYLHRHCGIRGPFLIVAPLSTAAHWQREFEAWTDFNAVIYHGSYEARQIIEDYEFASFERSEKIMRSKFTQRFNALIVPDSMLKSRGATGDAIRALGKIDWKLLVCDEGHRLKNTQSELAQTLSSFSAASRIILTGTPIQNNLGELWSVLNFLDPSKFSSESEFLAEYGDVAAGSTDHLDLLQQRMAQYFLRRVKEDVEKNIPPRQETLIEVDLSRAQKVHYKALYQKDLSLLMRGNKADMPSLENLGMQLRKCCQHPWLLKGVEDEAVRVAGLRHSRDSDQTAILQLMVDSSGKFILLRKMLLKLREEGHRVLVFSQMTRVLDLIEDAVQLWELKHERIDGGITGNARQAAIDRFCKQGSDRFLFLLSTKAGGLGLNLQVADTIIIFDSDWNPQNDLQAIARSHRIGQTKEVQVYRLIARNSYENEMFDRASRKLGLGHAIMGSMMKQTIVADAANSDNRQPSNKEELALMLRKGFYYQADESKESTQLTEDTFDRIMERDAKVIEYRVGGVEQPQQSDGGSSSSSSSSSTAAGGGSNRFSKASFVTEAGKEEGEWNDADFWQKMFPEHALRAGDGFIDDNILMGKRKRKMLHGTYDQLLNDSAQRNRRATKGVLEASPLGEDGDYEQEVGEVSSDSSGDEADGKAQQKGEEETYGPVLQRPSLLPDGHVDLLPLFMGSFQRFGYGRWARIRQDMDDVVRGRLAGCAQPEHKASLEKLLSCVVQLSDDQLRCYSLGWLKMLYIHRQYDVLFALDKGDSGSDEDSKTKRHSGRKAGQLRMRPVGQRDGSVPGANAVDVVYSPLVAADARTLILEHQRLVKEAKEQEKQRLQRATAVAAVDALAAEAAALIRSASQSSSAATAKTETDAKAAAQSGGEGEEEDEEVSEAELRGLHFLDLLERVPVSRSLLTKQKEAELKKAPGASQLRSLQQCYTLRLTVQAANGEERGEAADDWTRPADFQLHCKPSKLRGAYCDEHLGQWWQEPEDDWQLLKGLYMHGLDRLDLLQTSPHLTFHSRMGTAVNVRKANPAYSALKDAAAAQQEGTKASADAKAAFFATSPYVTRVVRVSWPDDGELSSYTRQLLSSLKQHLRNAHKKAAKHAADEQKRLDTQRRIESAERALQKQREEETERRSRREEAKAVKRRADDAVRQMQEQQDKQQDKGDLPPLTATADAPPLSPPPPPARPLSSRTSSGLRPKVPQHSPLPMPPPPSKHSGTSPNSKQSHITTFFTKPKLPLVEMPAAQARRDSSHTPSSSHTSTLSSSATLSSSTPHSSLSLFGAPSNGRRPTHPPVSGWSMELPSPSSSSSLSQQQRQPLAWREVDEEEEEGDIDDEEEGEEGGSRAPSRVDLLPRLHAKQRVHPLPPPTPRAPAAVEDENEDDIIVLLSDEDDL